MIYFLIILISAMLFFSIQQIAFKKYNSKFLMWPLITAIVLMLFGIIGHLATIFISDIMSFVIMALSGFSGMIVCTAMLIVYKTNTRQ